MTIQSATSAAPLTFAAHLNAPMPRGLRQEAAAMSFEAFHDHYASSSGPLRLGNWQCTDAEPQRSRNGRVLVMKRLEGHRVGLLAQTAWHRAGHSGRE